jgi:hypothetical protein
MQLVKLDALEAETAEAHLDALDQVAGAAYVFGSGWSLTGYAALGSDDQSGGVGVQGFGDEALGDFGAICVGSVDEVDAKRNGAAEDAAGLVGVSRLAPRALADKPHSAVAEAVDRQVAADLEGAAG